MPADSDDSSRTAGTLAATSHDTLCLPAGGSSSLIGAPDGGSDGKLLWCGLQWRQASLCGLFEIWWDGGTCIWRDGSRYKLFNQA